MFFWYLIVAAPRVAPVPAPTKPAPAAPATEQKQKDEDESAMFVPRGGGPDGSNAFERPKTARAGPPKLKSNLLVEEKKKEEENKKDNIEKAASGVIIEGADQKDDDDQEEEETEQFVEPLAGFEQTNAAEAGQLVRKIMAAQSDGTENTGIKMKLASNRPGKEQTRNRN
jgi:hypothetical protein